MENVKLLATSISDVAKDLRLNLTTTLSDGSLSDAQRLGIGLACAYAVRSPRLVEALLADAAVHGETWIEDAKASAALMAMNNVYYRFRHKIGKESYGSMPARLRMQRIAQPKTTKIDFELMCLAVSAINDCEMCVQTHERSLLALGASEELVHDAVRIAASINGAAVALELDSVTSATESP